MADRRTLTVCIVLLTICNAIKVEDFYPFGNQHGDKALPKADDLSSSEIPLRVLIAFYDNSYRSLFVNLNGHLSFEKNFPGYKSDVKLPTGRKLIIPFMADIDTRVSGDVFYRETTDRILLDKASKTVRENFSTMSRFHARSLFIATWNKVGYYREKSDRKNTFQVVIISDGRDSLVLLNYAEIEWIHGEGKANVGLPDFPAQAGFENGGYDTYTLPATRTRQIRGLAHWSNVNERGVWLYRVGNVRTITPADDLYSVSNLLEVAGQGETEVTPDSACKTCHAQATCVRKNNGQCCKCNDGFFGNGHNCIETGVALRINGKLSGNVNGFRIDNVDTHSYIVTSAGRTFTAVSRIQLDIGPGMRVLSGIGGLIGWLFSQPTRPEAKNGYMLTGGVFNHTAEIRFPAANKRIQLKHFFRGHDNLNTLLASAEIKGEIPEITEAQKVTMDAYEEEYRHTGPGKVVSSSVLTYVVDGLPYRVEYDQVITFDECPFSSDRDEIGVQSLKVKRNYLRYNSQEQTIRYAIVSFIGPKSGEDPCRQGAHDCSPYAHCDPSGDTYQCRCQSGYRGDGRSCTDVNECNIANLNDCEPVTAQCFNLPGSYECRCRPGYRGDGKFCQAELRCEDLRCDVNARCLYNEERGHVECVCLTGFQGDGTSCTPIEFSCNEVNNCGENAECVFDDFSRKYECQCNDGFSGDGLSCSDTGEPEINCRNCDANARCNYDVARLTFRCECIEGFTGDGKTCSAIDQGEFRDCNIQNNCDRNAKCLLNTATRRYECRCSRGYRGDGQTCEEYGCDLQNYCDRDNGNCIYDDIYQRYRCQCNAGYKGDGIRCELADDVTCNVVNNCDSNAECIPTSQGYRCNCRQGFQGDGIRCTPVVNCLRRRELCDSNAVCERHGDEYVCVCRAGYRGDGRTCTATSPVADSYLMFSQGSTIMQVPFNPTDSNPGSPVVMADGETVVGLEVDCYERYVFWTDVSKGTISRSNLDGSNKQVILDGLESPEGVAVDWIARNIYWTDSERDSIEVAKIDGTNRKTLIRSGLVNPRAIVLDPPRGKMYWSDWNREDPKIEVAEMDGSSRQILVKEGLGLPNGLTIDYYRQELCWADAGLQKIECVRVDGGGRRTVYSLASYPFSITQSNDAFYWTDWNIKSIQNIGLLGGNLNEPVPFPLGGTGKPYSIVAVPARCPGGSNACVVSNGGCRYLCLPDARRGRTCACPDDVDEAACNEVSKKLK